MLRTIPIERLDADDERALDHGWVVGIAQLVDPFAALDDLGVSQNLQPLPPRIIANLFSAK